MRIWKRLVGWKLSAVSYRPLIKMDVRIVNTTGIDAFFIWRSFSRTSYRASNIKDALPVSKSVQSRYGGAVGNGHGKYCLPTPALDVTVSQRITMGVSGTG